VLGGLVPVHWTGVEGREAAGDGLAQPAGGPAHSAETRSGSGSYTQQPYLLTILRVERKF
jgi:hypothetical protein